MLAKINFNPLIGGLISCGESVGTSEKCRTGIDRDLTTGLLIKGLFIMDGLDIEPTKLACSVVLGMKEVVGDANAVGDRDN
jgi:hypothetical protein